MRAGSDAAVLSSDDVRGRNIGDTESHVRMASRVAGANRLVQRRCGHRRMCIRSSSVTRCQLVTSYRSLSTGWPHGLSS